MIPKVAHYAGFQSYGDLPYPSLKPGRKALESNTVYLETVREADHLEFYDNFNRTHTVYKKGTGTVEPQHYTHPVKVSKHEVEGTGKNLLNRSQMGRTARSVDPHATQTLLAKYENEHFEDTNKGLQLFNKTVNSLKKSSGTKTESKSPKGVHTSAQKTQEVLFEEQTLRSEFLQTGVEHWKSTYDGSIKDPYAVTRASRPEWSLHKGPYQVDGGKKKSEYKTTFGERGHNPLATMAEKMLIKPPFPKSEDELKLGTTNATYHTPGYSGYVPKNLSPPELMVQATGSIPRTTFLKQNITENYHTRLPGYAGHKPRCALNDRGVLRQSCFSTQGERFY